VIMLKAVCFVIFEDFFIMAANVLGIGEIGAFKVQMFNLAQMLIGIPMLKFSTSAPILPIPCYQQCFFCL
jgi:hypothetical protein